MYVKPNMETSKHNSMKREVSNKSDDTYKGDPWKVIESYFSGTHLKRAVRHQIESYNDEIAAKFKLSSRIAKNQLLEDAETTNQTNSGKPLHKKSRSFRAHKTAEGKVYYSDTNTNETRWYLPEDAVLL